MFNISSNHIVSRNNSIDKVQFKQYKQAVCNYLFGDYLSAQSIFAELAVFNDDFYQVNELLGVIYISQGKYKEAVASFQDALKYNQYSNFSNYYLGILYSQFELYSHAAMCYLKALRSDPENSKLYYHLSKLNLHLNNKYVALNYLNKVIDLEPRNLSLVYERAILKETLGELGDAIDDYKILIKNSPFNSLYYFEIANLELVLGNYSEAKENLLVTIDLEPNSNRPLYAIANLFYLSKEYEKALTFYKKAKKIKYEHSIDCNIGFVYSKLGEYNNAIESFKEPLQFYEETKGYGFNIKDLKKVLRAYVFLGNAFKKLGIELDAQNAFEKAYNFKIGGFDFYELKANIFSDVEEYEYSVKAILNEIESDSANCNLYVSLGNFYKENEQYGKAQDAYSDAFMVDSLNFSVFEGIGDLNFKKKNYSEAISSYEQAISLQKDRCYLKYKMAICRLILGEGEKAKSLLLSIIDELKDNEIIQIEDELPVLLEHGVSKVEINKLEEILNR